MKLAKSSSESEVIRRLGGSPSVGDALIRKRDGAIAVVIPLLRFSKRYLPGDIRLSHTEYEQLTYNWPNLHGKGWKYLESASSFAVTPHGWIRMAEPRLISIEPVGILLGTLGNANLEMAAAVLVLYYHENDLDEWSSILAADFFDWIKTSEKVRGWMKNPVWRPNFVGLMDDGWIEGWTTDEDKEKRMAAVGTMTPKFIEAVSTPRAGGFPKIKRVLS